MDAGTRRMMADFPLPLQPATPITTGVLQGLLKGQRKQGKTSESAE
jgi:hypothetical protein